MFETDAPKVGNPLPTFGWAELTPPQLFGVVLRHVVAIQYDALVADHPAGSIGLGRIHATGVHVVLGAGHKECPGLMQRIESRIVEIAAIHDVKSARLNRQNDRKCSI